MASKASADAVWPLKEIIYPPHSDKKIKIVYQQRNGPCSLLAICNILILRGDIEIQPPGRKTASYEYLSSLVADFLVNSHGAMNDGDLTAALAVLPSTQEGMDLNPLFTGITSFQPAGHGGELKLFELCNVILVHGWLADPQSPEYEIVAKAKDYDTALNMIVAGEEASASASAKATEPEPTTSAAVVTPQDTTDEPAPTPTPASTEPDPEPEEDTRLRDALVLRQFLEQNSTQLTFHGLWSLYSLDKGLYALIRNSHLSVLHKYQPEEGGEASLWTLVTDSNLVPEPSIVWESLEDVDGASSRFVDSHLFPSSTLGGDFAGHTPEDEARNAHRAAVEHPEYDTDLLLAQQLQAHEEEIARMMENTRLAEDEQSAGAAQAPNDSRRRSQQPRDPIPPRPPTSAQQQRRSIPTAPGPEKKKDKKDCIIM